MNIATKHYQRNPDFIFREIVEEMILIPIHQNVADMDCIYTLNELGAFIWDKLEQPSTQIELEQAILSAFETDEETVRVDIEKFLQELQQINAIEEV